MFEIFTHSERICNDCDLGMVENTLHLVMQCPMLEDDRKRMSNKLREVDDVYTCQQCWMKHMTCTKC